MGLTITFLEKDIFKRFKTCGILKYVTKNIGEILPYKNQFKNHKHYFCIIAQRKFINTENSCFIHKFFDVKQLNSLYYNSVHIFAQVLHRNTDTFPVCFLLIYSPTIWKLSHDAKHIFAHTVRIHTLKNLFRAPNYIHIKFTQMNI